ncbi:MAG: hypothetical protein AVDCRST_MAG60-1158 [uncultured Nocardioides sp.]|uniref:Uncharacterized protein n=1 Tax=uncultured Nocardioides sp. TaxID=198441 RepID=A0A6J4NHR1_9ACTN|nr:MAG: hypothetical protein AVDCRST_MAG60-1158 [uncultured Nocardioides sp.]
MSALTLLTVLPAVVAAAVEGPAPEDVKAGWVALIIFLLLAVAVALLGFSLTKHLRISRESRDLGAYGDSPADESTSDRDDTSQQGGPAQSP